MLNPKQCDNGVEKNFEKETPLKAPHCDKWSKFKAGLISPSLSTYCAGKTVKEM